MVSIAGAQSHPGRDSATGRGAFLITIDTEGDDLWSKPREITAHNATALPRFQELCERYGLRPTYLVNWEMVRSEAFVEFGRSVLASGAAEIGMHLHAWNSPPVIPLTADDFRYQPYLLEYPEDHIAEKVKVITDALETTFGVKMVSHRAGRWGLDAVYARILSDFGYTVDCSVTPHVDWRGHAGRPDGKGGPDYRSYPDRAYFLDLDDVSRAGDSQLLEVPMTVLAGHDGSVARGLRSGTRRIPYVRRLARRYLPAYSWLRPRGRNRTELLRVLRVAREEHRDYVEFMLHSSELMAGGSPTFPTSSSIESLYDDLEALFEEAARHWAGQTLAEYRAAADT